MIIDGSRGYTIIQDGIATMEQAEVLDAFAALLRAASADGGRKRAAGTKQPWRVDPEHEAAIYSHIKKWERGELVDSDSGAHPLVHVAWRALAAAYQHAEAGKRAATIDAAREYTTGAT